jgi:hypothetical protein
MIARHSFLHGWGAFAVAFAVSGSAHAQEPAERQAERVFTEGRELVRAGKCNEAIPKFLESLRLHESVGAHLSVAQCLETNDPAGAWRQFREAERLAQRTEDQRASFARAHAAALESRLALVRIQVQGESAEAQVRIDGRAIDLSVPVAVVAPGEHVVEATLPTKAPWSQHVRATIGQTVDVRVTFESTDTRRDATTGAASQPPSPARGASETSQDTRTPQSKPGSTQRTIGLVVGAVGVAGVIVGSIAGLVAMSARTDAKTACETGGGTFPNSCTGDISAVNSKVHSAGTSADIATVGFIAGAALLGVGATVYLTAPHAPTAIAARLSPGGVAFEGRW